MPAFPIPPRLPSRPAALVARGRTRRERRRPIKRCARSRLGTRLPDLPRRSRVNPRRRLRPQAPDVAVSATLLSGRPRIPSRGLSGRVRGFHRGCADMGNGPSGRLTRGAGQPSAEAPATAAGGACHHRAARIQARRAQGTRGSLVAIAWDLMVRDLDTRHAERISFRFAVPQAGRREGSCVRSSRVPRPRRGGGT